MPANKCLMLQKVSAKFPVRSEPGILLKNREIFRRETGNRRAEAGNRNKIWTALLRAEQSEGHRQGKRKPGLPNHL